MHLEKNLERYMGNDYSGRIRRAISQFWKYCIVGATGYVVNFAIFSLLVGIVHLPYTIAATISFGVSATNNFLLNKYWTFQNPRGQVSTQAGRFLIVSVASWALNMLILVLLIEAAGMSEYLAQALAISSVTLLNFTGNKLWSFRQPPA